MKGLKALLIILIFFACAASAQVASRNTNIQLIKVGTVNVAGIHDEYLPSVQSLEEPQPGRQAEEEELATLKEQVSEAYATKKQYPQKSITRGQAANPILYDNFSGNGYDGDPNDNYMAVSNGGILVSMVNTSINFYDINTGNLLSFITFSSFDSLLGGQLFDPRIYYDAVADRFIIVFLDNTTSPYSNIAMAFSQTNNPAGKWNLYSFPGNPYHNQTWSDFPSIASTQKEFFLTLNMVFDDSTWRTGFRGTVIYQVNKESGYNGNPTLKAVIHDSIYFNNQLVRDLTPVKGGSKDYGPNMYFLTTKTIALQNDTVFLVEVPDTIGAPDSQLTVQLLLTPDDYFLAPNARQAGYVPLSTNDSRVLGAFYENGVIQYVHNAMDTATGRAAILHGVISNITTTPAITTHIIGDTPNPSSPDSVRDFGYPNISYAGSSSSDNSAIISFDHTGLTSFAGLSAIYYDGNGNYSNLLTVHNGSSFIEDVAGQTLERWGDYSGSQRLLNETGMVWVTGYYGTAEHKSGTWVAEIGSPATLGIPTLKKAVTASNLYPNPTAAMFSVTFTLPETQQMVFSIYDVRGALIKQLLSTPCTEGENIFYFSTAPLATGVYILKAQGSKGAELTEKVIKN